MKTLVIGATGGTGFQVVKQALDKGLQVTAFVRNPSKLTLAHENLKTVQGDVLDKESLARAVAGHQAVACCLGAPAFKAARLRSQGTENIVAAMQECGVSRLVVQTSLGYADSTKVLAHTSFVFRNIIVPFVLKKTFKEHQLQETIVKNSGLAWTVLRPGNLTDGALTGKYRCFDDYIGTKVEVRVSRADVAHCMVEALTGGGFLRQAVGVSY